VKLHKNASKPFVTLPQEKQMPQISDDMSPGPDLDSIDFDKLDKGDVLPDDTPPVEDKKEPVEEKTLDEALDEEGKAEEKAEGKDEPVEDEEKAEKDEPARDEKTGKFTKKEGENRIPKSRFNEAVNKEREAREAAEQRVHGLEKQVATREREAETFQQRDARVKALDDQISEMEKAHAKAILDGNAEAASEVMGKIRAANRQVARLEAQEESAHIVRGAIETERLQLTIAQLESTHPELNPRSDQYDDSLVQMILLMQKDAVERNIATPALALRQATDTVMKRFAAPKAEESKEGLSNAKGEEAAEKRREAGVKKALDAQKRTPASTSVTGLDSDKAGDKGLPNVKSMSVEEYGALPESTRAKMRGDMLV
jgi:ssDNA-binding Zn-finger/Zn-ribbon topoisomerase 1